MKLLLIFREQLSILLSHDDNWFLGQLTIPKSIRKLFGIVGASKAIISIIDGLIIVKPKKDFWSLEGSLATGIKLSNKQLRVARKAFGKLWGSRVSNE